jgi:hypothetical protein
MCRLLAVGVLLTLMQSVAWGQEPCHTRDDQVGTCMNVALCPTTHLAGYCSGPTNIQCCVPLPQILPSTVNMTLAQRFVTNSFISILREDAWLVWLNLVVATVCVSHSFYLHRRRWTLTRGLVDIVAVCLIVEGILVLICNNNRQSEEFRVLWVRGRACGPD